MYKMQRDVVESFFRDTRLTKQALYSYDDFVSRIVPEVIDNHRPIELKPSLQIFDESTPPHKIQISNVRYDIPSCVEKNGDIRKSIKYLEKKHKVIVDDVRRSQTLIRLYLSNNQA